MGINKYIPKKLSRSSSEPIWYNTEIRRTLRQQRILRNRLRKGSCESLKRKFRNLRNKLKKLLTTACNYFKQFTLGQSLKENPKFFWKYVKSLRKSPNKIVSLLNSKGDVVTENMEIVKALNSQFLSVFTKEDTTPLPQVDLLSEVIMSDVNVSTAGVQKLLETLDPHKSLGTDNISPRILKELAAVLSPFLSNLFQQSIDSGEPIDWKLANVCPINKSGCHKNPGNYRPASLTSIVSKTLEHIIYSHIMAHLNKGLITDNQHGFRQGHSFETQLAIFVHAIQSALDKGKEIDAVFLDFAKAFDTVPPSASFA